jgi:hypothetical protein
MATRVAIDGTAEGEYTIRDLRVFLETWDHLGMPDDARIHAKTKITGSGPLKTLTAEFAGTGANPAAVMPNPELRPPASAQTSWSPTAPSVAMPRPADATTERFTRLPPDEVMPVDVTPTAPPIVPGEAPPITPGDSATR